MSPHQGAAEPAGRAERLTILFTEGSSTSARQALYALGPRHTIDILDPARLCQCRFSRYVRRWYRCPSYSREPEAYLEFLFERLQAGRYDVLLPTHEQVFLLARFRQALLGRAGLALPAFESVDRLMNKATFARLLEELGLPYPATEMVVDRAGLLRPRDFPLYVKVAYSTAGQGVRLVQDRAELEAAADQLAETGFLDGRTELLVQRPARGIKRGATAVFQRGQLASAHCEESRAIGVGGSSMAKVSVEHPEMLEHLRRLGEHLQWHGALCVEYFYEASTGRVEFIECNPRIGETATAWLSGANLCEQLVQVSLDRTVAPLPPGRAGVRTHQGFLVLTARALEGAGRCRLLAEVGRAWTGRGLYRDAQNELTRPGDDWLSVLPWLGVSLLLLARPGAAQWLVTNTVNNYSLHQAAVEVMRTLRPAFLAPEGADL